jgi:hypothetical protein
MINQPGPELDAFEDHLLAELKTVVQAQAATQPARVHQRRPRLWYLPLAGAVAAVVAGLVLVFPRPAPAYAVSGGNGKEVKVKVTRLEGAEALQDALRKHGITANITYLPADKECRPGRYTEVDTPGLSLTTYADEFEVKIPAGAVDDGNTFVLSAAVTPLPNNGVRASVDFGIAKGPVGQCTVVNAMDVP